MLLKHEALTEKIIRSFYKVYNTLGYGFLEKVYENALMIELRNLGLHAVAQQPVDVYYEEERVGHYVADIIVENLVIVELKGGDWLIEDHEAQLTNYLRATDKEVGLLLGFCKKPNFKRKIFDNELKSHRSA